jgi:hypothetical protein
VIRCVSAAVVVGLLMGSPAFAQGDGLGPAPAEAKAIVAKAVIAMGGRPALSDVKVVIMAVDAKPGRIRESHTLKLAGRFMHYASRRSSGAGFDVVLARGKSFLCDRNAKGEVTYVEDLTARDAKEGSYERDIMFMPLLLTLLMEKNARMDYRGKNSVGDSIVRAQIRPPSAKTGDPFVIRLRFEKASGLLRAAMGTVPWGTDKGKKRYCFYEDYRFVKVGSSRIRLPTKLKDQRGKSSKPREFGVSWKVNPPVPAATFKRPTGITEK